MTAVKKIKLPDNTTVDINDARSVVIGDGAENIVTLTNAEYQALTTKDPNTIYIVTDVSPGGGGGGDGTVTSVAMTVPTGLSVSGSPITTSGTIAVSLASGYSIPTTTKQSEWDGKQDALVSGTSIKTVNSTSLLGSGDVSVGTYSKPSGGIPSTDLASSVQTSLGKADTALQSFTETDPTVPSWAKASSKPSYTLDEVTDGSTRKLADYLPLAGGMLTGLPVLKFDNPRIAFQNASGTAMGNIAVRTAGTLEFYDTTLWRTVYHSGNFVAGTNYQKPITISTSEPTSSQGSDGDIWIVI